MTRFGETLIVLLVLFGSIGVEASLLFRGRLSYPSTIASSERYPEEVAIYSSLPPPLRPGYDLILHLHGFRMKRDSLQGRLESFDDVLKEFDFDSLLQQSGRKAIVVVPSSSGKCDDYESHLIPEARLKLFFQSVFQQIGQSPERIVLIGHSGAYRAMASISQSSFRAWVKELYLLDASYGEEAAFAEFAGQPDHRLVSVFRRDTSTAESSFVLWKLLHPQASTGARLEDFYRKSFSSRVLASQLPPSRDAFVVTDGDHWRVVNDFWPRLIAPVAPAEKASWLDTPLFKDLEFPAPALPWVPASRE